MRVLLLIFAVVCAGPEFAQSQIPPPTPPKAEQNNQPDTKDKQQPTSPDQRGTEHSPLFIKVIPALPIEPSPSEHTQQANWYTSPEWWLVLVTIILAAITAILAGYTAKLWGATKTLAKDAKQTAARQTSDMQASLAITSKSADAALLSAQNMQAADRAYIKMSHMRPGLIFNEPLADVMYGTVRTGDVMIEVSNIGKTPARITAFVMTYFTLSQGEPLPPLPPYDRGRTERPEVRTTMYGTDAMSPNFKMNLSIDEFTTIHARTSRLYLLIYADYIDQFEVRHRAGYARRYDPESLVNNLVLVTQRDYNYDIQRKPGQGDDWNDPI